MPCNNHIVGTVYSGGKEGEEAAGRPLKLRDRRRQAGPWADQARLRTAGGWRRAGGSGRWLRAGRRRPRRAGDGGPVAAIRRGRRDGCGGPVAAVTSLRSPSWPWAGAAGSLLRAGGRPAAWATSPRSPLWAGCGVGPLLRAGQRAGRRLGPAAAWAASLRSLPWAGGGCPAPAGHCTKTSSN